MLVFPPPICGLGSGLLPGVQVILEAQTEVFILYKNPQSIVFIHPKDESMMGSFDTQGPLCVWSAPCSLLGKTDRLRVENLDRMKPALLSDLLLISDLSVEEKVQKTEVDSPSHTFKLIHAFDPSSDQNRKFKKGTSMQQPRSLQVFTGV